MFKTGLWAPKEEYIPFTGEPARTSLTEPPRGYRTPSPTQPYGVGRDKCGAEDRQERARQIVTTPDRALFDGLRHVLASLSTPPTHQRTSRDRICQT